MSNYLQYFILLPLLGFVGSLAIPRRRETPIFVTTVTTIGLHGLFLIAFTASWLWNGGAPLHHDGIPLYHTHDSHFAIDYYFDIYTAVYGIVAAVLAFLVSIFSRYYIHREPGYKRFFNNILFFYLGLSFILFAGNIETLFIGWEVIGITSFFLIGFYRERYLPIKNALKVVSIYRVADIFLLLAIWACHHYFKHSITFSELQNGVFSGQNNLHDPALGTLIPWLFLVVALVKSAQAPFSSWLPRAMEGPTTSSAIFYGSLSVHIGVFLLVRTFPLWSDHHGFRVVVGAFGLVTVVLATLIARVQSNIKTQIAYSSIAQIGLMFIEVALGWHVLALFHFAGNAFLRTYQLLVSPSILSYLIHDQFFNFIPPQHKMSPDSFWGRILMAIYVLSIKEWNLDQIMFRYFWKPLKKIGTMFHFITLRSIWFFLVPLYVIGDWLLFRQDEIPNMWLEYLPLLVGGIGLIMVLRAFSGRSTAWEPWLLIVLNQLYIALAIAFNERFDVDQIFLYLSGIIVSAVVGGWVLLTLSRKGENIDLSRFHGHSYEYPRLSVVFLIASLGLAGFPITPTFIGEDIILGHIHEDQIALTIIIGLSLIITGLAIFRIYSRLFMGPHEKGYHEVAYRSS